MKRKLSEIELLDYMDDSLDAAHRGEVEEFLRTHAGDAEQVADMKLALAALHDWDESEPVRASDDFWPKLRDKLPDRPRRSWWRQMTAQARGLFGESVAPLRLQPLRISMSAAVVAVFVAMAVFLFAPRQSVQTPYAANQIPPDAQQFITQSMARHQRYDSQQPLGGSLPVGDTHSVDSGDPGDSDTYQPK